MIGTTTPAVIGHLDLQDEGGGAGREKAVLLGAGYLGTVFEPPIAVAGIPRRRAPRTLRVGRHRRLALGIDRSVEAAVVQGGVAGPIDEKAIRPERP